MNITGLNQAPFITPTVPSLIEFWNAGFTAHRALMTYAVETGSTPDEFFAVAQAQVPLLSLILGELNNFSHVEWAAIPGVDRSSPLNTSDREKLGHFRHNRVVHEYMFASLVEYIGSSREERTHWHEEAQHVYRKHPALGPMLRNICMGYMPGCLEHGIEIRSSVNSSYHFMEPYFDDAKIAFGNIIANSVRLCSSGNTIDVSNKDFTLCFKDDGPGMEPSAAARLLTNTHHPGGILQGTGGEGIGWPTIVSTCRKFGWTPKITTAVGHGMTVTLILNPNNFYPPDKAITGKMLILDLASIVPAARIVESAHIYANAQPFQGYTFDGKNIKIVDSPLYAAIEYARTLIETL
jgi:hypothetical protein